MTAGWLVLMLVLVLTINVDWGGAYTVKEAGSGHKHLLPPRLILENVKQTSILETTQPLQPNMQKYRRILFTV